ncbi:hypothetical protein VKT23_008154 [Stygiomarasmius scandens]|uniref:Bacteriophage protein n=1 Tax=Marasmiellus scandens TaxID=2682957 RepID=A0ABR1JJN9_9AGAR
MYAKFERILPAGELDPWAADQSYLYEGISANCRYFTVGRSTSGQQSIPFGDVIDPDGILQRFIGDGVSHTTENTVLYLRATRPELPDSKWRYTNINPMNFSIGDIVEMQFTVMAVHQKQGNYKVITVLKSLALLDDSIALAASASRNRTAAVRAVPSKPFMSFKRIRYDDSDDETELAEDRQVRTDMAKLRISEATQSRA